MGEYGEEYEDEDEVFNEIWEQQRKKQSKMGPVLYDEDDLNNPNAQSEQNEWELEDEEEFDIV